MFLYLTLVCFVACYLPKTEAVATGAVRLYRNGVADTSQSWSSGIVQIYYDNEWGNICDDSSFGSDEADVICHQLGYTGASSFTNPGNTAKYDSDSSGVAMDDVSCSTSSYKAITQCSFSTAAISSICTNNKDVIVECYSTRIWDSPLSGDLRLTGGMYSNEGRLEVYCNGEWGTVCNQFFLGLQATLSCKQLGYNYQNNFNYFSNIPTNASQSIWLNALGSPCSSSTDSCLTSCGACPVSALTTCTHSQDVTLECEYNIFFDREQDITTETTCYDKEPAPVGTARFFRHGSPDTSQSWSSGIVQVYYSGQWGNIYDDGEYFGSDEADVICHQLGYTGASYHSNVGLTTAWGRDASNTVIRSLNCASAHPVALTQCPFSLNYQPTAGIDDYDVVLTCYVSRIWNLNPSPGDIRLTGGKYSNEGLLEVYCNGQWGTVCDDSFAATEAQIACRQLGYNDFDDYNQLGLKGNSSQKIWVDTTTTCSSSTDTCLTSCGHCNQAGVTRCNHDNDVTLSCGFSKSDTKVSIVKTEGACAAGNSGAAYSGGVRLIRNGVTDVTQSWSSGIVQVYYDDKWGNICSDTFGSYETDVICHQLGYTGASSYSNTGETTEFGTDTSPAVFHEVVCSSSSYLTVTQCSFSTSIPAGSVCDDTADAIVSCYSTRIWDSPSPGDIRLSGGAYTNQGLLEVYCNGEWGTVCDDYFDGTQGVIACRQLGYNNYEAFTTDSSSSSGRYTQSIWLHVLTECFTNDICLTTCGGCPSYSVSSCSHTEDIFLTCKYTSGYDEVSTDTSNNCDMSSGLSTGAVIGAAVGAVIAGIVCLIACISIPVCICVCCGVGIGTAAAGAAGSSGTNKKTVVTNPIGNTGSTAAPMEHYPASYPANPTVGQQPPPNYTTTPNPVYPTQPPYPYPIDGQKPPPPA